MSNTAIICYAFAIMLFVIYFCVKVINHNYIFSIFNISTFIYCFAVFITPIFYTQPEAWAALGVTNYTAYYPYLDKCLIINSVGLILNFSTMLIVEFNRNKRVCATVYKWSGQITNRVLERTFFFFVVAWYMIVLYFNKGLPLFNNGRTFYYNTPISPVYLALNEILLIYSLYFGMRMVYNNKKDLLKFVISVLTLIFTGNRGPVLVSVLVPILFLYIYSGGKSDSTKKFGIKKIIQLFVLFFIIALVGIALGWVRSGQSIDIKGFVTDILYGNNFSDIRDGAFILKGFENKFGNSYLYGKTYLAGIISFIPSGLSNFRLEWSFGRMTTTGLFGWQNHFGLRGGYVMEAYLNFGWLGILFFGIMQGLLNAWLEKIFYYIFYLKRVKFGGNELLIAYAISSLGNFLVCTSGMYNIYVDLLFILFVLVLSKITKKESRSAMTSGEV